MSTVSYVRLRVEESLPRARGRLALLACPVVTVEACTCDSVRASGYVWRRVIICTYSSSKRLRTGPLCKHVVSCCFVSARHHRPSASRRREVRNVTGNILLLLKQDTKGRTYTHKQTHDGYTAQSRPRHHTCDRNGSGWQRQRRTLSCSDVRSLSLQLGSANTQHAHGLGHSTYSAATRVII